MWRVRTVPSAWATARLAWTLTMAASRRCTSTHAGRMGGNVCLSIVKAARSTVPSSAAGAAGNGATNAGVETGKARVTLAATTAIAAVTAITVTAIEGTL